MNTADSRSVHSVLRSSCSWLSHTTFDNLLHTTPRTGLVIWPRSASCLVATSHTEGRRCLTSPNDTRSLQLTTTNWPPTRRNREHQEQCWDACWLACVLLPDADNNDTSSIITATTILTADIRSLCYFLECDHKFVRPVLSYIMFSQTSLLIRANIVISLGQLRGAGQSSQRARLILSKLQLPEGLQPEARTAEMQGRRWRAYM